MRKGGSTAIHDRSFFFLYLLMSKTIWSAAAINGPAVAVNTAKGRLLCPYFPPYLTPLGKARDCFMVLCHFQE